MSQPGGPKGSRAGTALLGGALCALIAGTLGHAHAIAYVPDGLPTWDSAGYLLEAEKLRELLASGDARGFLGQLTRPDLHPPLHALLLALWMSVFGPSLAAARAYPLVAYGLAVAGVVGLGRAARPEGARESAGTLPALWAAAVFALGLASLDLLCTPMTESSALLVELAALGVAVRYREREDPRALLGIGLAIWGAGMVRYNLWPMLGIPVFLERAVRPRPGERVGQAALGLARVALLLALPTAVLVGLWQLGRPELSSNIQKFLENRSSGIPFWSVENLAWVPIQTTHEYVGTWLLSAPLFGLWGWGLIRQAGRTLRREPAEPADILRIFVLVGFAALTAHDFKVVRNLHTVLPVFYLCAFAELGALPKLADSVFRNLPALPKFADSVFRNLPALPKFADSVFRNLPRTSVAITGLLLAWGGWQNWAVLPALAARSDFTAEPAVLQTLQFIERHAAGERRVWVTGWVFRISPNLIDWWLRTHPSDADAPPVKLKLDQPLFGEQTRTGVDSSWKEAYRDEVQRHMLAPDLVDDTVYVTLETAPGTRYADDWKAFGNNYARAFAELEPTSGVPEVDRASFIDQGLVVRAWRKGGAPSPATLASRPHPPDAADDAGVELPPGTPLRRDTLHGLAPAWRLYPPKAVALPGNGVTVDRSGSHLAVTVPAPVADLQLCSDVAPLPVDSAGQPVRRFAEIVNLSTSALSGKAWIHVRGMDADGKLVQASTGPDITMAGPLAASGGRAWSLAVDLDPAAVASRTCIVLGEAAGTVSLEDVALYPDGAAPLDAGTTTPNGASVTPADDVGIELPAGRLLFREPFNRAATGWRVTPEGAATTTIEGSALVVHVPKAVPRLEVCGPTFPVASPEARAAGGAEVPALAVAHLRGSGVTGHGAVLRWRGLDADGVLQFASLGALPPPRSPIAPRLVQGPLLGDATLRSTLDLRALPTAVSPDARPSTATQVRPCLEAADTVGTVRVEDLAIFAAPP